MVEQYQPKIEIKIVKRKTKRTAGKKIMAFLKPFGVIIPMVVFTYTQFKDTAVSDLIAKIKIYFEFEDKSNWPLLIILCSLLLIIALLSYIIGRLYLPFNNPNKKYFEPIDFKEPTDDIIRKSVEGILNSEKTEAYFVHVAPVSDEIGLFYHKLDSDSFVWENGKPGDGKSMLAFHALYRYRKRVGITTSYFSISLFELKYKIYKLILSKISEVKDIDAILDELDYLKGGRRKIILIDDAHKLPFESKLRWEFEEEAKDKINGKFVWINTNYLETSNSGATDSINIEFENFYPKLLVDFYKSDNPIIKEIVRNRCTGLQDAINLVNLGKIKDPWHFNFVASNGELRINQLLEKLSASNWEQDILLLSLFLFSVRNIITGEKEINQKEFTALLSSIVIPDLKKHIELYKPDKIIADLGSQEKGRFIIIENKNSLDRGFLKAPHYRLSKVIINTITTKLSENSIKQLIDVSRMFLTNNFTECKYFGIYLNSLGKYQQYLLLQEKPWIKLFLTDVILEQLHVYPLLLSALKKHHPHFFQELLTDEYINTIASKISLSGAGRFKSIQEFIRILGKDKDKLINKLNWELLSTAANQAEVFQLAQVAEFIYALGDDKDQLVKNLNSETLARTVNKANTAQLTQVANFINPLGKDKIKFIQSLDWEKLAVAANKADVASFGQLEAILNALGGEKEKLVKNLDWEKLATAANKADVAQFKQIADFLNALGIGKKELIQNLDWETLATAANKANVTQLKQIADFINALGSYKDKLIQNLDWETLARAANKANVAHLIQIADFLYALGNDKEQLSEFFIEENIISYFQNATWKEIRPLCYIIASFEIERQKSLICNCNWIDMLNRINLNHSLQIKNITYILYYQNKKQEILNLSIANQEVVSFLVINKEEIVRYSTQFFISPSDFQSGSNLLNVLFPHSLELCRVIADKMKFKIIWDFKISPRYYQSFSNLLNSFNKINSSYSKYIIADNNVKSRLYASFDDKSIKDQLPGLKNLLQTIQNTVPSVESEIARLNSIKDLKLDLKEDENSH